MNFKNGDSIKHFFTEPCEIGKFVDENVTYILGYWIKKAEELEKENRQLKDNEYVKIVEEENKELRYRLQKSFEITTANRNAAKDWEEEHLKNEHPDKKYIDIHYEFHPTAIGTMGYCVCDYCKEKFYLGEV